MSLRRPENGDTPEQIAKRRFAIRLTRDGVLFAAGLLGILHETILATAERPTLLLLFGAMVGLPAFLRMDEKRGK